MSNAVNDAIAEALEKSGLWRRASHRWLEVMQSFQLTDGQRDWIRIRRKQCLSRVVRIEPSHSQDFAQITRAAKALHEQMGLNKYPGTAFRVQTGKVKNKIVY